MQLRFEGAGANGLDLTGATLRVADAEGDRLEPYPWRMNRGPNGLEGAFRVVPLIGRGLLGAKENPALGRIAVTVDGVRRDGQRFPVRIPMEGDL